MLDNIRNAIKKFLSSTSTYEKSVDEFIKDLQRTLIRSDVNVKLVLELTRKIRERAAKEKPPPGASRRDWFIKIVYEEITNLFGGENEAEVLPKKKPYVIMLVGVQGSGKTTTAGKLAWYYKNRKYKVGLVAADTFRPGAYHQLKQLAEKVGVMFYGNPLEKDPVKIASEGVKFLREKGADIIIVDTAGRHGYGEEKALLDEMKDIADRIKPDEITFILDASIGQKAYELARNFHEKVPIGSIIITKLDGTAKGGGALSAVAATGAKIKFIGTGEKLDEIEPFRPKRFVGRILGLGDIESLLERLSALQDLDLEKQMEEMLSGKLDMKLIYKQLKQIRRLGPLSKVLKMIPGAGMRLPVDEKGAKIGEEKMDKWINIIQSMTYEELEKPEIIEKEKSRMKRIAIGSGSGIEDVKELLSYYNNMKKMLKQLKRKKNLLKKYQIDQQWLGG
jgi:signal recognition particle subunit SRP54